MFFIFCVVFNHRAIAQNAKSENPIHKAIDSLNVLLQKDKADSNHVNHLNSLCRAYTSIRQYDSALHYGILALNTGNTILDPTTKGQGWNKGVANSYLHIGNIYFEQGEYLKPLESYDKALKIFQKLKDWSGTSKSFVLCGIAHNREGEYAKALDCYFQALGMHEKSGDKKSISDDYVHIGTVYAQQGNYPKVLENYFKALKIKEELGDKKGIASSYNNIGIVYKEEGNYKKALEYFFAAIKIKQELGDKKSISGTFNNVGLTYWMQGNYDLGLKYFKDALVIIEEFKINNIHANVLSNIGIIYEEKAIKVKASKKGESDSLYNLALEYYIRSLQKSEELGDQRQKTITLGNIGTYYANRKNMAEGEKYLLRALEIDTTIGYLDHVQNIHKVLSDLYLSKGDFKKAYHHHRKYTIAKDSIFNIEKHEDITRKELNYEFDKKEAVAKSEQEKIAAVTALESKRQKIIIWSVAAGLLLMAVFAVFILRSLRVTQRQKQIIQKQKHLVEEQKHLVEEKHKEISDSINYAERIQRALLAGKNLLEENLKNYFILFKPKDVVSGDFYWAEKLTNGNFILVTADSTGHGVPGAIMSILNIACLKEAVSKGITSADALLNETRKLVIDNLKNDGSREGGKDGMDASLLIFDFDRNVLTCACANNPVWIIRDGQLIELKPDRMPVGKHDKDKTPFTLQTFTLQKNDLVYALTDGYADQFGGAAGKKFKYKKLQEMLLEISNNSMEAQRQKLDGVFEEWRGSLEQIDDVCIIGIRI